MRVVVESIDGHAPCNPVVLACNGPFEHCLSRGFMRTAARIRSFVVITCFCFAAGCGGSNNTPSATTSTTGGGSTTTTPAMSVYVLNDNDAFAPPQPSSVLQFGKTASGSVSPISTITGPANVIFRSMVEDGSGNLYVAGYTYNANPTSSTGPGTINILEYGAGSSGPATPATHDQRGSNGVAADNQQLHLEP
jgi:hypothetical protein